MKLKRYVRRRNKGDLSESEFEKQEETRRRKIEEWNLHESWNRYKREYRKQKRRMDKANEEMFLPMESEEDFSADYYRYLQDMVYQYKTGERDSKPSPKEIVRLMVSHQKYEITYNQAKVYKRMIDKGGYINAETPVSLTAVRKGLWKDFMDEKIFDEIKKRRKELRSLYEKLGVPKDQINKKIADKIEEEFVDSPK